MLPAITLSLILVTLYATLAHFLFGHTWRQMGGYWLAGGLGYGLGALGALWLGVEWGRVGAAPVALGSVGAWLALLAARWKL